MIDEKKLIEDIEQEFVGVCVYDVSPSQAVTDFIEIVDRQPIIDRQPKEGEWIPCSERLPDETGRYLAVKKRIAPDELGGSRTNIVILRFFVDDGFLMPTHIPDWINEEINEEVTHWMPLPQPPKGGNMQ